MPRFFYYSLGDLSQNRFLGVVGERSYLPCFLLSKITKTFFKKH